VTRRRLRACAVLAALLGSHPVFTQSPVDTRLSASYQATIRRTEYGIPHISATDRGSLAFGEGYAFAQDHLCSLADQVVMAHGERAKYFGPGPNDRHLHSDISVKALRIAERAAESLKTAPAEQREALAGYAAGYNTYLAEVGVDRIPGWCRGAAWVRALTAADVAARIRLVSLQLPLAWIATASPPGSPAAALPVEMLERDAGLSNGWAIGSERSETGGGLLFANPHYPWVGANRFWEKHLTIPGQLDVYGVSLLGIPGVAIGFTRHLAWTHTVSAGERMTGYLLHLVPGTATSYMYDGKPRPMTTREVEVEVRQADGSMKRTSRTVYFSHFGPVINFPGLPWTSARAIAVRDANAEVATTTHEELSRARTVADARGAHVRGGGTPFTNTILATADGRAYYIDAASAPYLSDHTIKWWKTQVERDGDVKTAYGRGLMLLDGQDPQTEWITDARARVPGLVPAELAPQLERADYVFNANDSYWISHAQVRLTGFSPVHGSEGTRRSLRTRMNARILEDVSPTGPSGSNGRFSLAELWTAGFTNRSMSAQLLKDAVVERCCTVVGQQNDGKRAPLVDACQTLERWDGKFDLDSRGAVLWREFVTQAGSAEVPQLFATPFDPADPIGTPHGLAAARDGRDIALELLERAAQVLMRAGLAFDVPLGAVQFARRGDRRIPLHGGLGGPDGITNIVNYGPNTTTLEPDPSVAPIVEGSRFLTRDGYPINRGSSFVMAVAFTDAGPQARAVLTYGQSGDPNSPHYSDQTELFSRKGWREVLFTEQQIAAEKALKSRVVTGPRQR
jgi:acyl-homoserine-lactone acylase